MKTPRSSVRDRYPVTASDLQIRGTLRALFETTHPPDYVSKGKRVRRWKTTADLQDFRRLWGIFGRTGARIEIRPVDARTNPAKVRAFGSLHQMQELHRRALTLWATLPGGREIETLFATMFPREIVLTPEEIITDPTALKRMRKKAAPPAETPAAPPAPPADHPELIGSAAEQPVRPVCLVCEGDGIGEADDITPSGGVRQVSVPCRYCDGTGYRPNARGAGSADSEKPTP